MPPDNAINLAPVYTVTFTPFGGGQAGAAPDSIPLALLPVLRGEQGAPGSAFQSYPAATALSGHIAITLDSIGRAIAADCRTPAHAFAIVGVTTTAAAAGAEATSSNAGLIESSGWGLTPDMPLYLGESGAIVHTVPASAAFTKIIGRAISSTAALIELQPAIFTTN